jgi:cysteinyl-tRNA synthetase
VVRYLLASVPYRKKLNFTFDGLKAAAVAIDRLRNFKLRLETDKHPEGANEKLLERTAAAGRQFEESLDDDLNTAEALAALFEFVRDANSAMDAGEFRAGNTAPALDVLARFDRIFAVLEPTKAEGGLSDGRVEELAAERAAAKKARNFARSDKIRQELLDAGIILEDTKEGARWKRK